MSKVRAIIRGRQRSDLGVIIIGLIVYLNLWVEALYFIWRNPHTQNWLKCSSQTWRLIWNIGFLVVCKTNQLYLIVILGDILGISNKGSRVFKFKVIPTIEGFVYDDVVVLHMGKYDFAPEAKIKNQDLLLKLRIIHMIITHNSFPKNEHCLWSNLNGFVLNQLYD